MEVAQSFLERMDALEPSLNAWVRVDRETVLSDSQQRQTELESGAATGPLHGVPIGIKDIYHMAGIPTTAGSKVYANYVPGETAVTIDLLRKAGAIMLGKTVTTEFACLDPSHAKNPWNPAHTPGGSSSGSGAATAAFLCAASLGADTGGPVRFPASWCGLAGIRPTWGRVSRYGVMPGVRPMDTIGPLGRTVAASAITPGTLAGPDPHETTTHLPTDPT